MKLSDRETEKLLKKWDIPHTRQFLARNAQEAFRAAKSIGYPVALKVSSPDIIHKTEFGGLVLNLKNDGEVRAAYNKVLVNSRKAHPKARIEGVMVQEMAGGIETIVGAKQDPTFGPVIMFGVGGIFVEILKDVSFRLVPIEKEDAREMIREIKGYPLLAGARGAKPVKMKALEEFLLKVSRMVQGEKRIQELDINPLFIDSQRAVAADVRILVK